MSSPTSPNHSSSQSHHPHGQCSHSGQQIGIKYAVYLFPHSQQAIHMLMVLALLLFVFYLCVYWGWCRVVSLIASVSLDLLCQEMENDGEMEDWRENSDLVMPEFCLSHKLLCIISRTWVIWKSEWQVLNVFGKLDLVSSWFAPLFFNQFLTPIFTIAALPVLAIWAHSLVRISYQGNPISSATAAANDPHLESVFGLFCDLKLRMNQVQSVMVTRRQVFLFKISVA